MNLIKEDLKNKIIRINNNNEWIRIQLILFSYNIEWKDSGKEIFRPESKGYNIIIKDNYKMACYHGSDYNYTYLDIEKM